MRRRRWLKRFKHKVRITCSICGDVQVYFIDIHYRYLRYFCRKSGCELHCVDCDWNDTYCEVLNRHVREPRVRVRVGCYV